MSIDTNSAEVSICRDDLLIVSAAMDLRYPLRAPESHRIERMRELLSAASELSRALAAHSQHSLVDCQGSHGMWDLAADAEALFDALAVYSGLVRHVATEYRSVFRDSVPASAEYSNAVTWEGGSPESPASR